MRSRFLELAERGGGTDDFGVKTSRDCMNDVF